VSGTSFVRWLLFFDPFGRPPFFPFSALFGLGGFGLDPRHEEKRAIISLSVSFWWQCGQLCIKLPQRQSREEKQ
jgi:hypothetical protein